MQTYVFHRNDIALYFSADTCSIDLGVGKIADKINQSFATIVYKSLHGLHKSSVIISDFNIETATRRLVFAIMGGQRREESS